MADLPFTMQISLNVHVDPSNAADIDTLFATLRNLIESLHAAPSARVHPARIAPALDDAGTDAHHDRPDATRRSSSRRGLASVPDPPVPAAPFGMHACFVDDCDATFPTQPAALEHLRDDHYDTWAGRGVPRDAEGRSPCPVCEQAVRPGTGRVQHLKGHLLRAVRARAAGPVVASTPDAEDQPSVQTSGAGEPPASGPARPPRGRRDGGAPGHWLAEQTPVGRLKIFRCECQWNSGDPAEHDTARKAFHQHLDEMSRA